LQEEAVTIPNAAIPNIIIVEFRVLRTRVPSSNAAVYYRFREKFLQPAIYIATIAYNF